MTGVGHAPLTDAQKRLVEENLGLARFFAHKYAASCAVYGLEWDDLYSIACLGLVYAARRYDPSASSPATYMGLACERKILCEIRRYHAQSRQGFTVSTDAPVYRSRGESEPLTLGDCLTDRERTDEYALTKVALEQALEKLKLPPKAERILRLSAAGLTQQEIGARLGCSQAQISRLQRKYREKIREAMT